MRSLKKNQNGYTLLLSAVLFAGIMLGLSWFIDGAEDKNPDDYVERISSQDPEADLLTDPAGWIGDRIEENSILKSLTLDCTLINSLGFIGLFIKVIWGILMTIGFVELIWIG